MSWQESHERSQGLSAEAEQLLRQGHVGRAWQLFAEAATLEAEALRFLDPITQPRTYGITAVSAVALWYKGNQHRTAEAAAYGYLSTGNLPRFAELQLRSVLQSIWNEAQREQLGVRFAPGQVIISIKGGLIAHGGAPADLILDKVQTVQSIFYRAVEMLKQLPLRRAGPPTQDIQEACKPWLFQGVPASYQFAVMVQQPPQADFFKEAVNPSLVADTFMAILEANIEGDEDSINSVIPDEEYRKAFVKLTRNLAPTGKTYEFTEVRRAEDITPLVLAPETRKAINATLRRLEPVSADLVADRLLGTLRAVHLDKDWLEVHVNGRSRKVWGVVDTVDDVIGPMVNHRVTVDVFVDNRGRFRFRDIELDD